MNHAMRSGGWKETGTPLPPPPHSLAFPLGRSCAPRGAAGPADGELVPVEHLVDGVSIVQCEAVERVAYFHVELDSHNVIVAEGEPRPRPLSIATAGGCSTTPSSSPFSIPARMRRAEPSARRASTTTRRSRRVAAARPARRHHGRDWPAARLARHCGGRAGPRLGPRCREFGHTGAGRGRRRRRRAWVHARQPLPRRSRNRRLWPRPARFRIPFSRATRL